jgi:hypothetical protein
MSEQLEFLKEIVRRLDSAEIPYMVTGSLALVLYARPRMTRDVDLVIACRAHDAETIVGLFSPDCYVDGQSVRDAVAARTMFNVIHNQWIIKADFIVRKDDAYRREEFARRRRLAIDETPVWVAAPEDLVLSKLLWSRDSGSELQREDARAILHSIRDLDWAYLEKWAASLGIQDLLAEARKP